MSSRKYSPLSSTVWSDKQTGKSADSESRKSVDEILDTLETFTKRCEVLLEPFMLLTDFLSTQLSPTLATTRPALTALFMRLLALTPIWFALTLPPLRLITTQRVVLVIGTIVFTWHSRSARVSRTILWRSRTVRYVTSQITGLHFAGLPQNAPVPAWRKIDIKALIANSKTTNDAGVRFTFALFENQRRWLGVGWTSGMLLHERQAWTDETNNTCPEPSEFKLPETDSGSTKWVWVAGSEWHVEGTPAGKDQPAKRDDNFGWTYFDWQWRDPRKTDAWGRYTRRRRWVRDAELVESGPDLESEDKGPGGGEPVVDGGLNASSGDSPARRKAWFGRAQSSRGGAPAAREQSDAVSVTGSGSTGDTVRSRDGPEEDVHTPHRYRNADWDRSIGEGLAEGLS
nr:peroxisomal membrane protein pex30 [Quercus suber]